MKCVVADRVLSVLGGADASWVREGLPFGGVLAPQVGFDGLLQFRGLGEVGVPFGDEAAIGLFVVLFVLFFILRFGFQEHDILAHHIKSEGLALADALDLAVGKREDIAAPAVAKGSLHAVGGIEGGFVDLALLGGGEQVPASRQVIPMR